MDDEELGPPPKNCPSWEEGKERLNFCLRWNLGGLGQWALLGPYTWQHSSLAAKSQQSETEGATEARLRLYEGDTHLSTSSPTGDCILLDYL